MGIFGVHSAYHRGAPRLLRTLKTRSELILMPRWPKNNHYFSVRMGADGNQVINGVFFFFFLNLTFFSFTIAPKEAHSSFLISGY